MAIKGIHAMFYTGHAEEMRAFLRDNLGLPFTDTGDGWLIFNVSEVEIGCHPSDRRYHEFSFITDDIHQTVTELKERGVEFIQDIKTEEWGLVTKFRMPDGQEVELYQPTY